MFLVRKTEVGQSREEVAKSIVPVLTANLLASGASQYFPFVKVNFYKVAHTLSHRCSVFIHLSISTLWLWWFGTCRDFDNFTEVHRDNEKCIPKSAQTLCNTLRKHYVSTSSLVTKDILHEIECESTLFAQNIA